MGKRFTLLLFSALLVFCLSLPFAMAENNNLTNPGFELAYGWDWVTDNFTILQTGSAHTDSYCLNMYSVGAELYQNVSTIPVDDVVKLSFWVKGSGSLTDHCQVTYNDTTSTTFEWVHSGDWQEITVSNLTAGKFIISVGFFGGTSNPYYLDDVMLDYPASYTITASAGSGGTITPSGAVSVASGDNQSFEIAASGGYAVLEVLVNGVSQDPDGGGSWGTGGNYTFSFVSMNHTIAATFYSTGGGGGGSTTTLPPVVPPDDDPPTDGGTHNVLPGILGSWLEPFLRPLANLVGDAMSILILLAALFIILLIVFKKKKKAKPSNGKKGKPRRK